VKRIIRLILERTKTQIVDAALVHCFRRHSGSEYKCYVLMRGNQPYLYDKESNICVISRKYEINKTCYICFIPVKLMQSEKAVYDYFISIKNQMK